MHLSRYIIPARAPLWGREEGGYATSDLPLFILTFWSLHGAHAGQGTQCSFLTCMCSAEGGLKRTVISDERMHESILAVCVRRKMYVLPAC